ncbi:Uncharacterised protein [uncultured archaeon]|nr:Uncharacterised protein [uncultured archaeon]
MLDIQQFQILAQLIGNMEISSQKLDKAYQDNDGEGFKKAKEEIMDIQDKISKIIK